MREWSGEPSGCAVTGARATNDERQGRRPRDQIRLFVGWLLDALHEINLGGLAAQVAYSLIFAMPSILLILAFVARVIDERTGFAITDEVRAAVTEALPIGVRPVVTGLVDDATIRAREGPTTLGAIVAIVVALVAAGNGLGEMATAFDRAADIEDDRPRWLKRFIFTGSAVLIAALLIVAFAFYVWGGSVLDTVASRYSVGWYRVSGWQELEAPFILLLVFLGTNLLYLTGSGRYCFRLTAPGAAISTLFWLLLIKGFQLYLSIANPGTAYGAASSVLVFFVFLYLCSMGLIVGAMSAAVIVREACMPREPDAEASSSRPTPAMRAEMEQGGRG